MLKFGRFLGRRVQHLLQKMLLGTALLLQAGFGLCDGLFEGVDFAAELVKPGTGGVESVVLPEGLLELGEPVFDGRLAVYETSIAFDASGTLVGFGFVPGYFGLEPGRLAADFLRFCGTTLQVLNLEAEFVGAKVSCF